VREREWVWWEKGGELHAALHHHAVMCFNLAAHGAKCRRKHKGATGARLLVFQP